MENDNFVAGVDLGGTNIRAAVMTPQGVIINRVKISTGVADGYNTIVERIAAAVKSSAKGAKGNLLSVGIASPGAIDFGRGVVVRSPNFPDWRDAPLKRDLAAALNTPVELENDANAAALGEGWTGAAKSWGDFVMFTLGTGVGSGIVLNRRVFRGPTGMAGEMGHITAKPDGKQCGCGGFGCVETIASANAVAASGRERATGNHALWLMNACGGDLAKIDAAIVAKGAFEGDALCRDIMNEAAEALGCSIAAAALVLGITKFVIGGGMSEAMPVMEEALRKSALAKAYTLNERNLVITRASLGDDAGVIGAAKTALDKIIGG